MQRRDRNKIAALNPRIHPRLAIACGRPSKPMPITSAIMINAE